MSALDHCSSQKPRQVKKRLGHVTMIKRQDQRVLKTSSSRVPRCSGCVTPVIQKALVTPRGAIVGLAPKASFTLGMESLTSFATQA
eukprot:5993049-Amphidinium_carterae.1